MTGDLDAVADADSLAVVHVAETALAEAGVGGVLEMCHFAGDWVLMCSLLVCEIKEDVCNNTEYWMLPSLASYMFVKCR